MTIPTYYKCVRHDYASFRDPSFTYGPVGTVVKHPDFHSGSDNAAHYISVATVPTDCTGFAWRIDGKDSRLLVVEPVDGEEPTAPHLSQYPYKRALSAVRVMGELPITAAFGPNGEQVVRFLEALNGLSAKQWAAVRAAAWDVTGDAARDAAGGAALTAAGGAALTAARDAARDAAGGTALTAAWAVVVRDKITPEQFDILVAPMRAAGVSFDE